MLTASVINDLHAFQKEQYEDYSAEDNPDMIVAIGALIDAYTEYLDHCSRYYAINDQLITTDIALKVLNERGKDENIVNHLTNMAMEFKDELGVTEEGFSIREIYEAIKKFILDLVDKVIKFFKEFFKVNKALEKNFKDQLDRFNKIVAEGIDEQAFSDQEAYIWTYRQVIGVVSCYATVRDLWNRVSDKTVVGFAKAIEDNFTDRSRNIFILGTRYTAQLSTMGWSSGLIAPLADRVINEVSGSVDLFKQLQGQFRNELLQVANIYDKLAKEQVYAGSKTHDIANQGQQSGILVEHVIMTSMAAYRELLVTLTHIMKTAKKV